VLVVPEFYDLERDILPIQRHIYQIIGLVAKNHALNLQRPPFAPEDFDAGMQQLIAHDRRLGGEIYDAVKQVPAFLRLVSHSRNERIVAQLRATDVVGIAGGGYGIRIDHPREERFRAPWHQDYTAQLRSLDGVVFWSPLVAVTQQLGPVEFCLGSHRLGPVPVHRSDPDHPEKTGAYGLTLKDEARIVAAHARTAPVTRPGDLILVDFLTVHASGHNTGTRARWSMQFRYFNFCDPTGMRLAWCGAFAAGKDFAQMVPELAAP
jgi:hypothetical protein